MPLKCTQTQYGAVAVTMHWLATIIIVAALGSGFRAANTPDSLAKAQLLAVHAPIAIGVVLLTLARILWWLFADRKPNPVEDTPNWQYMSARAVHVLFYVAILGMGASGIGMFILSGAGPIVFASADGQLPNFWDYKPRVPHGLGASFFVALLLAHVGAALYHHFVHRDGLLRRMWFSRQG
ncbi:MAG: cytochrome b [Hyphomicrobiaceae bacterium]